MKKKYKKNEVSLRYCDTIYMRGRGSAVRMQRGVMWYSEGPLGSRWPLVGGRSFTKESRESIPGLQTWTCASRLSTIRWGSPPTTLPKGGRIYWLYKLCGRKKIGYSILGMIDRILILKIKYCLLIRVWETRAETQLALFESHGSMKSSMSFWLGQKPVGSPFSNETSYVRRQQWNVNNLRY